MSASHNRQEQHDEFDSVEGSRGSSGTQSPWQRDPSPTKAISADQHRDPQDEYLAHVGAGANSQPAGREQAENTLAPGEAVAPTGRQGAEASKAVLQTEGMHLSHDAEIAYTEEDKDAVLDPNDEAGSRMDVDEEEDRGDPKEQPKPHG